MLKLRRALTALHERTSALLDSHGHEPASTSPASNESRDANHPLSINIACSVSTQLIDFSAEHITVFVKTISEPMEILASFTCVRSMLESCAISAWLLDPAIDATERIGRVFAYRYEGMDQQRRIVRQIDSLLPEVQSISDRIDEVEDVATKSGYPRVQDRNKKRIGIGQKMPGTTVLIEQMLDQGFMYRVLSAVAHGHSWAIRQLAYQEVAGGDSHETMLGRNAIAFEKALDVRKIAYLGLCLADAFARALWSQSLYMGWNQDALEEVLEDVFDIMDVFPEHRFWRPST